MTAFDPLRSLGVPAILPAMNGIDPFALEALDRRTEVMSFSAAGLAGLTVPIWLAAVPLGPINLIAILAISLMGVLLFMRGKAARLRRLTRAKQANELRARLLERTEDPTSA